MVANWRQKTRLENFGLTNPTNEVCEYCGARLEVYSINTPDRSYTGLAGLHVVWSVTRPNQELNICSGISCTKEQLTATLEKAKKLAEKFAKCW